MRNGVGQREETTVDWFPSRKRTSDRARWVGERPSDTMESQMQSCNVWAHLHRLCASLLAQLQYFLDDCSKECSRTSTVGGTGHSRARSENWGSNARFFSFQPPADCQHDHLNLNLRHDTCVYSPESILRRVLSGEYRIAADLPNILYFYPRASNSLDLPRY